ncbi:PIG-L deacetylase family protein [Maribellus maritimus]|uniref:PIG-L deacetylase family protein n=1 Tax=Maribellus maritimus TaxID=2870838 RepID=UPI001EEBE9A3|nr:PIG-L family deacetylase [Maribellus maritimus]MCG6190234.1 PIG-L family deacetylase [Maribellus maritimus]
MVPISFKKDTSLSILSLGAHCDDIEIGAGCSLLKIFRDYKIENVNWVVFTSNEIRKKEATNSANQFLKHISEKKISIESYRDGFLPFYAAEIKEYFERLRKEINPDIIFTHYRNDRHQDHRLISDLTWNTWRNNMVLEYEIPKYDGDVGNPNFFVEVDKDLLDKRNGILMKSFVSQHSKHWFNEDVFSALPRLRGMESATQFAEAFYARKIVF